MTAWSNLKAAAAHAVRVLVRDGMGWLAVGLISEGAREVYRPAGLVTAGVLILAGVFLHARGQMAAPDAGPDLRHGPQ